jgi:hypothetical protein
LSGMWLDVAPRTEPKKTLFIDIELSAQNIITKVVSRKTSMTI